MPHIDQMQTTASIYNREFQEMTARIYADGLITCQEATEGTTYYKTVRPRIRRFNRHIRQHVRFIMQRYTSRLLTTLDEVQQKQLVEKGNSHLNTYREVLHEYEKLLNDSRVMLKIFADVLQDCE